jgi:ATPase family associated with various cellular activities (AAA)
MHKRDGSLFAANTYNSILRLKVLHVLNPENPIFPLKMPQNLAQDLDHLVALIQARLQTHMNGSVGGSEEGMDGSVSNSGSEELGFANGAETPFFGLSETEKAILLIALAPHIRPQILDIFPTLRQSQQQPFTEFGGHTGQNHHGFLPTGETALFILAGNDITTRFAVQALLQPEAKLLREDYLRLEPVKEGEPEMAGLLRPSADLLDKLITGNQRPPKFGPHFPARRVETSLDWEALVLPAKSQKQLRDLQAWMEVSSIVMDEWGMKDRLAPGYKVLFYGPPGTGKTFTAKLLGRATGREVYRIDLSTVVSKYIGETEKNLERIFSQAESKGWILFFDEADALFGKRTKVSDAHDRYANQEVSYLLQRLEEFDGTVILATNEKDNIDEAFTRRFQAMIHFPMPGPEERLRLWRQSIPEILQIQSPAAIEAIAKRFEIAGGPIMNVIRYAAMKAAQRKEPVLLTADLETGLQQELHKGGKLLH